MAEHQINLALRNQYKGLYTVNIRYYDGVKEYYLPTEFKISKEDWNAPAPKRGEGSQAFQRAEAIRDAIRPKVNEALGKCPKEKTFELFSSAWNGKPLVTEETIKDSRTWITLLDKHLELKADDYSFGTKRIYGITRAILVKIEGDGKDLCLQNFKTEEDYKQLERYLKSGNYGKHGRTVIAIHMQNIKAIAETGYNPKKGLQWVPTDAFKDYQKPSRNIGTVPNTYDDFKRLRDFDVNSVVLTTCSPEDNVRMKHAYQYGCDFWSFMVMCGGMEARSIAFLRWKDVNDGEFKFIRAKTANTTDQPVEVVISMNIPLVKLIFDRYANKRTKEGYVFPILEEGMSTAQIEGAIAAFYSKVTSNVQRVAKRLNITPLPSCKRTRPTFAVVSKELGMGIHDQKLMMGHKKINTTDIYMTYLPSPEKAKVSEAWAARVS